MATYTASNGSYLTTLTVTETNVSVANNTSAVRYTLTLQRTAGSGYHNSFPTGPSYYVRINGATVASGYFTYDFSGYSTQILTVASGTTSAIVHNSDGSKAVSCVGYIDMDLSALPTPMTASGTLTLSTIARQSKLGTISSFNVEDYLNVPLTKYSSSFRDELVIKIGTARVTTISNFVGGTFALAPTDILRAYNAMSSNSATFTFDLTTYSGSTIIGTDRATATGTAAGTARINTNGTWKRGVVWINVNGTWKRAIANVKVSNTWKRGT